MVARIKRGSSLSRTLNYNEQKVKHGAAECINAVGYPKDLDQLSFYDKLHRLEHQAALNERITANSVHISLNFADAAGTEGGPRSAADLLSRCLYEMLAISAAGFGSVLAPPSRSRRLPLQCLGY